MSSDILVRDQIFSTYDSLYDAEKKVADYLISHPSEAIEMSVSELASHCDASQAGRTGDIERDRYRSDGQITQ